MNERKCTVFQLYFKLKRLLGLEGFSLYQNSKFLFLKYDLQRKREKEIANR